MHQILVRRKAYIFGARVKAVVPLVAHQFLVHCSDMHATAIETQWPTSPKGAKVALALMANRYYPLEDEDGPGRVRLSISLTKEQHEQLELVARLWNALDDALERPRGRKWKITSVIERMVVVGLDGFWNEIGGLPPPGADHQAFINAAVERVKRQAKKK